MAKASVLLAEDNADTRALVQLMLETEGYEVIAAQDGAAAWQYLTLTPLLPDVVVTDLNMPHVSGIDLIKFIRADNGLADLPVLAMSALGREYLAEAMEAGATEVIGKPDGLAGISSVVWGLHDV